MKYSLSPSLFTLEIKNLPLKIAKYKLIEML